MPFAVPPPLTKLARLPRPHVPARFREPAGLALVLGFIAGVLLLAGNGLTFFRDDWFFVLYRDGHTAANVFENYAGHLGAVQVVAYLGLMETAGLDGYWAFRLVTIVLVLACAVMLHLYGRSRVGVPASLAGVLVVGSLGLAWPALLLPFLMGVLVSVATGVGALLAAGRGARVLLCVLLTVSVAASEVGLAFLVAAAVRAAGPRPHWRALWPVAVPALLYAAWLAWLGARGLPLRWANVDEVPARRVDAAAEAQGTLVAAPRHGTDLLVAAAFLVGRRLLAADVPRGLVAALALALAGWLIGALSGLAPTNPRMLFPGAVACVLIAFELADGRRLPSRAHARLALVLLALVVVSGAAKLLDAGSLLRRDAEQTRVELAAIEAAGARVTEGFAAPGILARQNVQVPAGAYRDARRRWGSSPAASLDAVRAAREADRRIADSTLAGALGIQPTVVPELPALGRRPDPDRVTEAYLTAEPSCVRALPVTPGASVELEVPPAGIGIRVSAGGAAAVSVRRYAGGYSGPLGVPVPGGGTAVLRIPAAGPGPRWHARVAAPQAFSVCNLG